MDNSKTGLFIREMRKEKNMTQKDLASQLNITDRAVSKWERGLCAPDIALLEPLSEILGCSVAELIAGEKRESSAEVSGDERCIIDYSVREINRKVGIARRRYRSGLALAVVIILAAVIFILRQGDYFYIIDRSPSPDGVKTITVYDKALDGSRPSGSAVSLIVDLGNDSQWRIVYGNSEFKGVWWAPDSKKYVLHLEQEGETQLALAWLERNSESNLSAYLSMGVEMSELSKYGYAIEDGWLNIEYQFLQWAEDSRSMLIYYSFEDADGKNHSGYFWYNCIDCTVSAMLETAPQKA